MNPLSTFYFNKSVNRKAKVYLEGKLYRKNELVTDENKTNLFIVREDFIASGDMSLDLSMGLMSNVGSYDSYKQLYLDNVIGGSSYTIDLQITNQNYNRHVFVLRYIPPTDLTEVLNNLQVSINSDSYFFVNDESGAGIATSWTFQTNYVTPNSITTSTIDLNIFNNIISIGVE